MTVHAPAAPCTCGGSGCCTVCVLNDLGLEASLMVKALARTEQAMLAPVIPLPNRAGFSMRVPRDAA